MNYLIYPTKTMNITQTDTMGNHYNHSLGSPKDYPFDEACADTGRDWFYCPCDEMKIVRIYGVGGSGVNTVWLKSTAPVSMPIGSAYVTIMVEHPEDYDLRRLKVGQRFKRGEKIFREGKDGNATGNHFHISVGTGDIIGNGWSSNGKAWVLTTTGKVLKASEAFYLDGQTIRRSGGYNFKNKPKEDEDMAKDNTPDKYAAESVNWAIKNKILLGDDTGDYKLHAPVTRQDMLVFLYRAEGEK